MTLLARSSSALRTTGSIIRTPETSRSFTFIRAETISNARSISSTPRRAVGESHSHYDAPTGWLWGMPPGQKYEKEGWENLWFYGFFGSLGLAVVAYAFKPDTR